MSRRSSWALRAGAVAWLTLVWCAVMESASLGTVLAGVLVGTALTVAFPARGSHLGGARLRPWALVRMNAAFFVALLRANLQVAWAVIAPSRAGLRRGIVAIPVEPGPAVVLDLLTNVVSLTPGTLILEVRRDPPVLYVHVLQLRSEAAVHAEVLGLQRAIAAALAPAEVVAAIDRRLDALAAPDPEEDPA